LDVQPSTTRTTDRKPFSDIKGKNSQSWKLKRSIACEIDCEIFPLHRQ
jgi:hypothetical protein